MKYRSTCLKHPHVFCRSKENSLMFSVSAHWNNVEMFNKEIPCCRASVFSDRSQMTSKCMWKEHNHILTSSVINCWTDARQHGISLFYNKETFCISFSGLVSLDWDCSSSSHFFHKETCFFASSCFWNLCTASLRLFSTSSFAQSCKTSSKFSNLSAIFEKRKENVLSDDVTRASVLW